MNGRRRCISKIDRIPTGTRHNNRRYALLEARMPYALFDDDVKISNAYPSEQEVWKHAKENGLVVDRIAEEETTKPHLVLDKEYEIRPCQADPGENPVENEKVAQEAAKEQPYLKT
jgi:hypothetical protein